MARFFNGLRRKFSNEGKTRKYLTYAIGEIFLVVIGILIALQINNWNEERKNGLEEKEIAKSLYVELLRNLNYTKQQGDGLERRIGYLDQLITLTGKENPSISQEDFFELVFYGLSFSNYRPIISRLDKILEMESFKFHQSPELMFELTNYKLGIEGLMSVDGSNTDNWRLNMQPFIIETYTVKNLVHTMFDENIKMSKHNADLGLLLDSLEFENNLMNTYIDVMSYKAGLASNESKIQEIINLIATDYGFSKQ